MLHLREGPVLVNITKKIERKGKIVQSEGFKPMTSSLLGVCPTTVLQMSPHFSFTLPRLQSLTEGTRPQRQKLRQENFLA